jgi:hypothetical protein
MGRGDVQRGEKVDIVGQKPTTAGSGGICIHL